MNTQPPMRCARRSWAGTIQPKDVFVATKLWNNNHRPERVKQIPR